MNCVSNIIESEIKLDQVQNLHTHPISVQEVTWLIEFLKVNKAPGVDCFAWNNYKESQLVDATASILIYIHKSDWFQECWLMMNI